MASVLQTFEFGKQDDIVAAAQTPAEALAVDAPLFRFRLRQLLAFVAATCALLAALVSASGVIALALTIVAAVVAMHVFATSLETHCKVGLIRNGAHQRRRRGL